MPTNPFAQQLFWPVSLRVLGLLAAGMLLVLIVERKDLGGLSRRPLFQRVRSWAFIAPIFLLSLFSGGFIVFLLAGFIALQGSAEYARLTDMSRRYALLLAAWTLVGLWVAALQRRYFLFLPVGFFMLLTLVPIISGKVQGAHRQVTGTLFGYIYIGLPMAYFVFVKAQEKWGLQFLLIVGLAVALSDVTAFTVGSTFKGPKLAPKVSPGKTWSGVAGNFLGAAAAVGLLAIAVPPEWTPAGIVALVISVAVGAVWGDLTESFVKRDFAVKDTGALLPGFGGILDRVDSLLLALPLAYYALLAVNELTA